MEAFKCTAMEEDLQVDTVRGCDFTLHSFDYADQQETVQPMETIHKEITHEESLDYNEEENIEVVQQKLQMKSKLALEKMIKSNITVDFLKHQIEDEKSKIYVLDEKILLLIDERDHLKNAEFIQNAKFNQLTRELEDIKNITNMCNKHCTEDDEEQQNVESNITKLGDLFEKFRSKSNVMEKLQDVIKGNAEKYKSLTECRDNTSVEIRERTQTLEAVLKNLQDAVKENDEILMKKREFSEEIITDNNKLKAAIEMETRNHERVVNELSTLVKITEDLGLEKNEKQIRMNIALEKVSNEIKIKENELESISQKEILLKQELDEMKTQNAAAYDEIDSLKQKMNTNRNILDSENDKIKTVQNEIEDISRNHNVRLAKIKQETENAKQQLASVTSERKTIIKDTEAVNISIDQLNKQLSHNALRVKLTQSNEGDLMINFDRLNKDKQQLAERTKSLEAHLEASNAKYNSLVESYNCKKVRGDITLEQLRNDVAESLEKLSSQEETFHKQMEDCKQAHAIQMHMKRSEHNDVIDKLQKVYEDLKHSLQTLTEDKMHLQEELVTKTTLKDSIYSQYNKLQNEADQLKMEQAAGNSQKPVGILKSPSKFVVPFAPAKSVTFKPTISWNSASSLDSLFDDMNKDSQHTRETAYLSSQQNQRSGSNQHSQNWDAFMEELLLNKESQQGTSEEVQGSYSSSPPVRLTDSMETPQGD